MDGGGIERVTYQGFESNGFAGKCIYIYVLSGRGRAPRGAEAGNARGGQRMNGTAQKDSNKKASDLVGTSPWFAPSRQLVCISGSRRRLGRALLDLTWAGDSRYNLGRNLWQQ